MQKALWLNAVSIRNLHFLLDIFWRPMLWDLIHDFSLTANTVAMGTKEQLLYNWINIHLLLRHSNCVKKPHTTIREFHQTCPWICMPRGINMCGASNVCGFAYRVHGVPYNDHLGKLSWYTSRSQQISHVLVLWALFKRDLLQLSRGSASNYCRCNSDTLWWREHLS